MFKFLRLFIKTPSKNSYYAERIAMKYSDLRVFYNVILNSDRKQLKTRIPICFSKDTCFDSTTLKTIKENGLPDQWIKLKKFKNYEILLYKTSVYGLKIKNELHFINNKLVAFNNNFPYSTSNHNTIVEILLREKYIPENKDFCELTEFQIFDDNGNFIFIENNGFLSINYVTGNPEMQQLLINFMAKKKQKSKESEYRFKQFLLEKI